MSELEIINSTLRQASRRRRLGRGLRSLWRGLLAGAVAAIVLLGAYKLLPLPDWVLLVASAAPVVGALAGAIIGALRPPTMQETARWVDGRQHLQERLSTALEVSQKADATSWSQLVLSDAASHAREIDPRRLLPLTLSRAARWSLILLILVAGLGFVPEYRSKNHLQKQNDTRNIQQTGKTLAQLTRRNLEARTPALEPTQKALETVAQAGDQLAKAQLTRSEALKELANVAEKLKDQLNDLNQDPALRRLQQASRAGGARDAANPAALQKEIDALQKQLGTPTGNPQALENIKRELEKLQQAAKAQAGNSGGSENQDQQMSAALSALSRQMQDMGFELPQLEAAIQALASSQTELFMRELDQAMNDLQKMSEMAKSLQQMQQQMEKMGKDLTEQLANGQPEAAQMTLNKMVQQLQSANLSQEQLKSIMEDVARAIDPAGNYGKVAEHLKQASSQMKGGNKPGASQELAQAAKELEKLMEQMGDAEALLAELQNLNQASMCIGNGMCWGPGKRPGFKPGGKPGSGVGTWADDDAAEWAGQLSERWDNSGIDWPEMDARGITDRGEGKVRDDLMASKVKGQFSPGGQMPSITLKGVSIKGQSTVQYEEAAATAQSEAQSALSQEKVPRAYQGAVRDYFDDLKK